MTTVLDTSLIRILDAAGKPVGAGFLVGDRLVATCTHVAVAALGLRDTPEEAPVAELRLDFPRLAAGQIFSARITAWDAAADLAGLELLAAPPADARPARLVDAPDLWGHPFRAFGFPRGYDNGVWASGRIRAPTANGWLQIEDVKATGYTVQPGFSGGPLWDDELGAVVGMVVAADSPSIRAAYGLPVKRLASTWQKIAECLSPFSSPKTQDHAWFLNILESAKSNVQDLLQRERSKSSFYNKYNPTVYIQRGNSEQDFKGFLRQLHHPCFVITGKAGRGKTNLICHLARQLAQDISSRLPILIDGADINFNSSDLEQIILANLPGEILRETGSRRLADLGELAQRHQAHIVIFLDAINEIKGHEPFKAFNQQLAQLLETTRGKPVLFCLSCRQEMWGQFSQHDWSSQYIFKSPDPSEPTLTLDIFADDNEFALAKERYFKWYRIRGELHGEAAAVCHDPLMLRVLCVAYSRRRADDQSDLNDGIEEYPLGAIDRLRRKEVFDRFAVQKREDIIKAARQAIQSEDEQPFEAPPEEIYQLTTQYILHLANAMYQEQRAYLTLDEALQVASALGHPDAKLGRFKFATDPRSIFFRFLEVGILDRKEDDQFSFVFELYFEYSLGRYLALEKWKEGLKQGNTDYYSNQARMLMEKHDTSIREKGFTNLFGSLLFAVLLAEGSPTGAFAEKQYDQRPDIVISLLDAMTDINRQGLVWAQQACAIIRELAIVQRKQPGKQNRLIGIFKILQKLSKSSDFVIMWDLENTLLHIARENFDVTLEHIQDLAEHGKGLQPIFATRALTGLSEMISEGRHVAQVVNLLVELTRHPSVIENFWLARTLVYTASQIVRLSYQQALELLKEDEARLQTIVKRFAEFCPNPYVRGYALAALPYMTRLPLESNLEVVKTFAIKETWPWGRWNLTFALCKWNRIWPDYDDPWIWDILETFARQSDEHLRYAVDRCVHELESLNPGRANSIVEILQGNPWMAELQPGIRDLRKTHLLGVVYAPVFMEPDYDNHVECRERLQAILEVLEGAGRDDNGTLFNWITPRKATDKQLRLVHNGTIDKHRDNSPWPDYVNSVLRASKRLVQSDGKVSGTGPSELRYESYEVALSSVGSVLSGIDYVMTGTAKAAFALNRPPGHLANNTICLFNNIAIGARYAMSQYRLKRVFIVDCDAHQGKHTHYAFLTEPNVVYFSLHVKGNYADEDGKLEHTGKGEGVGYNFNIPYPERIGDAGYSYIVDHLLIPAINEFHPDLILLSAGFDGHFDDPLAQPSLLTEHAYLHLAEKLFAVAQTLNIKIVGAIEGGYGLEGMARSLVHMLAVFGEWPMENRQKIGFMPIPQNLEPVENALLLAHQQVRERVKIMARESAQISNYAFDIHKHHWQTILDSEGPLN